MKKIVCGLILIISFSASAFNMAAYNIRNFSRNSAGRGTDLTLLEAQLREVKADLLSVEEIKDARKFKSFVNVRFPQYRLYLSKCGGGGDQKLGFLVNTNLFEVTGTHEDLRFTDISLQSSTTCGSLRPAFVISLKNKRDGKNYLGISLHLKASGRPDAIRRRIIQYGMVSDLVNHYRKKRYTNIAVFGDLNTVGLMTGHKAEINAFNKMLRDGQLLDMTKSIPCTSYWSGGTNDNIEDPSKLDHIFISKEFQKVSFRAPRATVHAHCAAFKCKKFKVSPDVGFNNPTDTYKYVSDHCPVKLSL